MYFCNLIDTCKVYRKDKSGVIPFVNAMEGTSENVGLYLTTDIDCNRRVEILQDDVLNDKPNLITEGILVKDNPEKLEEDYLPKLKSKLKFKDVQDTKDNPLILVLCKSISVYDGVPANIKFLYLGEEEILACLVYGSCEFDGIPMQRCTSRVVEDRDKRVFTAKDIVHFSDFKDKDTGYKYIWDAVVQVLISYNKSTSSVSYRTVSEGITYLTTENLEAYRRKMLEKRVREEARLARLKAERKEREEVARREKEEEERKVKEKTAQVTVTQSVGASMFLQAVANYSKS